MASNPVSGWRDRFEEEQREKSDAPRERDPSIPVFGAGGGPGWGTGQKKWRIAAGLAAEPGDKVGQFVVR